MRWSPFLLFLPALSLGAQSANLYSREREAALGAELAKQVERNASQVENPDALKYVRQVGSRLAMQLPDAPFPYTFKLVEDASGRYPEPAALPGGYIYVPTHLFLTARDESEFAGMLAHVMAHVAERHGTRQATRGALGQSGNIPLIFYGALPYGELRRPIAVPIAFVQYSNAFEEEADAAAVKMAIGAGYDPEGLLRYLTREQNAPASRLDALRAAMQAPAPSSNDEFLRLQEQLRNPPRN
jgi:predicted Zn-dependent protease